MNTSLLFSAVNSKVPSLRYNSYHVEPSRCEILYLTSFQSRTNSIFDSFVISFQVGWNCASSNPRFSRHRVAKRDEDKTPCLYIRGVLLNVQSVRQEVEWTLEHNFIRTRCGDRDSSWDSSSGITTHHRLLIKVTKNSRKLKKAPKHRVFRDFLREGSGRYRIRTCDPQLVELVL